MPSLTCPDVIRKVADRFKSASDLCFRDLSAVFAVAAFGCRSLCDAVRENGWMPSVSSLDRAVHDFDEASFMRRLRGSVLAIHKSDLSSERFCFAVDDTTVERFGNDLFARGYHPRHGKGGVTRAQRVMVLALVDKERGVATPIAFAMCLNKGCENYMTTQDLCFELVKQVIDAGFPALPTVADSGFDSMALMARFDAKKWTFVVECRKNRKVKRIAAPNHPWGTWKDALHKEIKVSVRLAPTEHNKRFRKTKYAASRRVQLHGRGAPVSACAMYNSPSDSEAFAFYVSNDLQMSGAELWQMSRARWHIEEMFRTLKQSLGFLRLPVRGEKPCYATICVPFAILASLQHEPHHWGGDRTMAVGQIVRQFRQRSMWKTFEIMATGEKRMSILMLKTRRLRPENYKKPSNPSADEVSAYFGRVA